MHFETNNENYIAKYFDKDELAQTRLTPQFNELGQLCNKLLEILNESSDLDQIMGVDATTGSAISLLGFMRTAQIEERLQDSGIKGAEARASYWMDGYLLGIWAASNGMHDKLRARIQT